MGDQTEVARVGLVDVAANLSRRLLQASTTARVEQCEDPVRFATDSAVDLVSNRALLIDLGAEDVWDLLGKLHAHADTCPVVALHHGDDSRQLRAFAYGVRGVVSREADPIRILRAVTTVLEGDAVLSSHTLVAFATLLPTPDIVPDSLTAEEQRWLTWLSQGHSVQQIADQTSWSVRSMRRRLTGLYLRIGAENRDQAVRIASRHGLLGE